MADPKDRKNPPLPSNAPDIIDQSEVDEDEKDVQEKLEDALIDAEEKLRRESLNPEDDDTFITSNAPNITDSQPRRRDERRHDGRNGDERK